MSFETLHKMKNSNKKEKVVKLTTINTAEKSLHIAQRLKNRTDRINRYIIKVI